MLDSVLDTTLAEIENEYRQIYMRYFPLISSMKKMMISPPKALDYPIGYILNLDIRHCLESDDIDISCLEYKMGEMISGNYLPDKGTLSFVATEAVERMMKRIWEDQTNVSLIENTNQLFTALFPLELSLDLWNCQNHYFRIGSVLYEKMFSMAEEGNKNAVKWLDAFDKLGVFLGVKCS